MADKVVIHKGRKAQGYAPVFVSIESHTKVKQVSTDTRIPMKDVLEAFIDFGLDHLEIIDSDKDSDLD